MRCLSTRGLAFPVSSLCKETTRNEKITLIALKQSICLSQGLSGNLPASWKIRRDILGRGEGQPWGPLLTEVVARTDMRRTLGVVVFVGKMAINESGAWPWYRTCKRLLATHL